MTATPEEGGKKPAPRHWLWTACSIFALLLALTVTVIYLFSYDLAKAWVQSPAGQRTASSGLGKAIKVDGEFAPLRLNGWTITTDSFTSEGWPGEAIGSLNAYGITAEFVPSAIWDGAYKIKGIQIDRAEISLIPPVDKLKRVMPPKKPRPWYAFLLPSRFECGPIVTPDAKLDFTFQDKTAHITHAHVQADLIGKDLQYTATSGVLEFPYLPPLRIEMLKMLVTRPVITVYEARLVGLDPADTARITLDGSIGQRENKAIEAHLEVVDLPIEQLLPEELASRIHGRASGKLIWTRDMTGKEITSDGELTLNGAGITDLSVFKQLAILHGNADLQDFNFEEFTLKFHRRDGVFHANIVAKSQNRFALTGTIQYEFATKSATLDFAFADLPLQTWLPTEFKPRYSGMAAATLKWHGSLATIKDSTGDVTLNLDGAHVHNPVLLRRMLEKKGLRVPDDIVFKTAQLDFGYEDQTFHLRRAELDLPGILTVNATGTLTPPDNTLDGDVDWHGLTVGNWLPPDLAQQFSGDVNGHVKLHVRRWKLADGNYGGSMELVHGQLRYTSVQSMLARFVNDRRLLEIPLTQASFNYEWSGDVLALTNIDFRGGNEIGLKGNVSVGRDGMVSGLLLIGTKEKYLESMAGLGDAVFDRDEGGLKWARVKVSGTVKKPQQDLSSQLMSQLGRHPFAIFPLSGKMVSWYVGNLFGEEENWTRPDVTVSEK